MLFFSEAMPPLQGRHVTVFVKKSCIHLVI